MSDRLKKLQERRREADVVATQTLRETCNAILDALGYPAWTEHYDRITDLVVQYGKLKQDYGYFNGAIEESIGFVDWTLDREAREYAEAAAAAGQQDLLDGPDPDERRQSF